MNKPAPSPKRLADLLNAQQAAQLAKLAKSKAARDVMMAYLPPVKRLGND